MDSSNKVLGFTVSARAMEGAWNKLRDEASATGDVIDFLDALLYDESDYMAHYHGWNDDSKDRHGAWKTNKFQTAATNAAHYTEVGIRHTPVKGTDKIAVEGLPNAYRSAKSIISTALEIGISVAGKGKTAVQKEIKAWKGGAGGDPEAWAVTAAERLAKGWGNLTLETQHTVTSILSTIGEER